MFAVVNARIYGLDCGRRQIHLQGDDDLDQLLFECSKYIEGWVNRNVREHSDSVLELTLSISAAEPAIAGERNG